MAEIIMTFALGFLIASLIAVALAAPLWRRAVQLTSKRLRASSPVSIEDFNADKDLIRAEFAMAARKLELSVEKLHNKAETRLGELDKREREVASLRDEMQQQVDLVADQQSEIEELKKHLEATEGALTRREQEYGDLQERLADAHAVVSRQANAIREANSLVEGQKSEINTISSELESKTEDVAGKTAENAQKAGEIELKTAAIAERDEQLARCGKAVVEQKMRVAEQRRRLGEQEKLIACLTDEIEAARRSAGGNLARSTPRPSWLPTANLRRIGNDAAPPAIGTALTAINPATLADRIRALQQHIRNH